MTFALSAKDKFNAQINHFATIYSPVVNVAFLKVNFKKVLKWNNSFQDKNQKGFFYSIMDYFWK